MADRSGQNAPPTPAASPIMKSSSSLALALLTLAVTGPAWPQAAAPAAPAADAAAAASPEPPRMIVDDGQIITHDFTVFVTCQLSSKMSPVLRFSGSHFLRKPGALEQDAVAPNLVAPHQWRTVTIGDTSVPMEGTLLTFNLSPYRIPFYETAVRLLPSVQWTEPPAAPGQPPVARQIVATDDVYLGNLLGSMLWTFAMLVLVVIVIVRWSVGIRDQVTKFTPVAPLLLITGSDGFLSLWRTQLLLWTAAVGGVVFNFGLLRLHVPQIPETLVALMGMSLLTGTVSSAHARVQAGSSGAGTDPTAGKTEADAAAAPARTPGGRRTKFNPEKARWGNLISVWNDKTGQVELSIPKAQMVFWTVIVLTLFVVKSILLGALWPVPWEMVILTGMSQAGYVGDKYVQSFAGKQSD